MTAIRPSQTSPQHAGHQKMIRRGPDAPDTRANHVDRPKYQDDRLISGPENVDPRPPKQRDRPKFGNDHFQRGPEDFAPGPPKKPGPPKRIDKDAQVQPPGPADRTPVPRSPGDDEFAQRPIHEPVWNRYRHKGKSEGVALLDRTPTRLGEKQVRSRLAPVKDVIEATQELLEPVVESVLSPIRWLGEQVQRTVEYTQQHPEILLAVAGRSSGADASSDSVDRAEERHRAAADRRDG